MRVLFLSSMLFVGSGIAGCSREPAEEPRAKAPAAEVPRTIDRGDGCIVEITQDGSGAVAHIGDEVTLAYEAHVKDTEQTIASTHGWDVACRIRLGERGVLPGLSRGLDGIRVGSKAKIEVPPALGYGPDGCPGSKVPADATLVFEVELLGVR